MQSKIIEPGILIAKYCTVSVRELQSQENMTMEMQKLMRLLMPMLMLMLMVVSLQPRCTT